MTGWRVVYRAVTPACAGLMAGAAMLAAAATAPLAAQGVDYRRAELLLDWHTGPLISGDEVDPQWIDGSDRFWYRNKTGSGHGFVVVDPVRNTQGPLFDHARLAAAMSLANDTSYVPDKLPFDAFEFSEGGSGAIEFTASKRRFQCDIGAYTCMVSDTLPDSTPFVESPDERWEAFVMDHDVYIRPKAGGDTIRITDDGEELYGYGLAFPRANQQRNKVTRTPDIHWAPNSLRLAVERMDERGVAHHHYLSYTPQRPEHFSQPYALPGDSVIPVPTFHVLDLEPALVAEAESDSDGFDPSLVTNVRVELEPRPHQIQMEGSAVDSLWSRDSGKLYVAFQTRASKGAYLAEIDAVTGEQTTLASDVGRTYVELSQRNPASWYVVEGGPEVFWWSERDGWAHLWRYDRRAGTATQITSGAWAVGAVFRVDEGARHLYFTAYGREPGVPYYGRLYRVGFDGSGLTTVADEEGLHEVEFSPSGAFFVDTYSQIGVPPVTKLKRATGTTVRTLEEADVSAAVELGWRAPEVFKVKARDGVTDIYGLIHFPPDLADGAKFPVIDHIYPGPQRGSVGAWSFKGGGENFALAELGFVVIQLDHLGTPHRSKAIHDAYYADFNDNGIPDHITAIKQLATRYPFMDLDRVGIYGHSGGGFASTDAILRFPDFFHVAVSGAGNHDNASYNIYWAEKYQGLLTADSAAGTTNFTEEANKTHAASLRGKLLLMHGDMDDNVHPAMTVQLVDELIKANRDFDLIWAPDRAHGLNEPYFIRRRWDYFVRHLLGKEPPAQYEITRPSTE